MCNVAYNKVGDRMSTKTNAIRIIEQAGIVYQEAFYAYDENDLCGLHAAEAIGLDPEQVYKTLVTRGSRTGINIFCIPVSCELDLKKAARAANDKSIEMVQMKELLGLTGYMRGGCSPVGMKRKFPTYVEETCQLFDLIAVSAGERGHQVLLTPYDLLKITDAKIVDIIA